MVEDINKFGLSRAIPLPIKREIRKRCGFGCVVCGIGIYQYEHILPEFKDAATHNPRCITLLCGSCHDKVTRGIWSKDKIIKANEKPSCIKRGYSRDILDLDGQQAEVHFGNTIFIDTKRILMYEDQVLLAISPPTLDGEPNKLSGIFCDDNSEEIFRIVENEWIGPITNWDIEMKGKHLIIRREHGNIALHIELKPPNIFKIKRLKMSFGGSSLTIKPNGVIEAKSAIGGTMRLKSGLSINCDQGLILGKNGIGL